MLANEGGRLMWCPRQESNPTSQFLTITMTAPSYCPLAREPKPRPDPQGEVRFEAVAGASTPSLPWRSDARAGLVRRVPRRAAIIYHR
jgi:hypothetical protein